MFVLLSKILKFQSTKKAISHAEQNRVHEIKTHFAFILPNMQVLMELTQQSIRVVLYHAPCNKLLCRAFPF